MKNIDTPLIVGKGHKKKDDKKKSFGYQILGFGGGSVPKKYIVACGGAQTVTDGDFKIHFFTSDATFTISCAGNSAGNNVLQYLVIAGGGGAAGPGIGSGGGGGGGLRQFLGICNPSMPEDLSAPAGLTLAAQSYPIQVGGGGSSQNNGEDSIFGPITSAGGGGSNPSGTSGSFGAGKNGGSGGGASGGSYPSPQSPSAPGGTGNTPPQTPPQGKNGGNGYIGYPGCHGNQGGTGGGGGSARSTGSSVPTPNPADYQRGGRNGAHGYAIANSFFGPAAPSYGEVNPSYSCTRSFTGGGGGGVMPSTPQYPKGGGTGGYGGGGDSAGAPFWPSTPQGHQNGDTNRGGGGGGNGGSGGSGLVVIKYKFQN